MPHEKVRNSKALKRSKKKIHFVHNARGCFRQKRVLNKIKACGMEPIGAVIGP